MARIPGGFKGTAGSGGGGFFSGNELSTLSGDTAGEWLSEWSFGQVLRILLLIWAMVWPGTPALGEPVSLLDAALFGTGGRARVMVRAEAGPAGPSGPGARAGASLFAGRQEGSLFAPFAPRAPALRGAAQVAAGMAVVGASGGFGPVARLRALIGRAEAGARGYDAVQYGATIRPEKRPTEMTLQEIYDWIDATPGQPHAIGYYQFIPATLKRLVARLGVSPQARFSPELQDRLGDILLAEAGLHRMTRGEIDRHAFMANLARIWAGLPTPSGLSYYHGVAGNRATLSWADFDQEMARIFPG